MIVVGRTLHNDLDHSVMYLFLNICFYICILNIFINNYLHFTKPANYTKC